MERIWQVIGGQIAQPESRRRTHQEQTGGRSGTRGASQRPGASHGNAPRQRREPGTSQAGGTAQGITENPRAEHGIRTDDGFLPPVEMAVTASIIHDVAKLSCTQSFHNESSVLIPRASYTFPLPSGSAVVGFRCRIGTDRLLTGRVVPIATASRTFEQAVRRNAEAGLLEQNTPEIFTSTLGNIPANTQVQVELSFIIQLQQRMLGSDCCTTLSLPLSIAPRYGRENEDLLRHLGRSAQLRRLGMEISILSAHELTSVASPSHLVRTRMGQASQQRWEDFAARRLVRDPRRATTYLHEGDEYLDRNFILDIRSRPNEAPVQPVACMERHPDDPSHTALMLTFSPDFWLRERRDASRHEIILLADRSGSMRSKEAHLRRSLHYFLEALPFACRFNIWSFGTQCRPMWPRSREYIRDSQRQAATYVDGVTADMGGTEMLSALRRVVASRSIAHKTDIIVLTDGRVTNTIDVAQYAGDQRLQSRGDIRFFCLGIGDEVSYELIESLARAGGGYAEVIRNASEGGWEERVASVLAAASMANVQPPSIEIHWAEASVEPHQPVVSQSPANLADISPFLQNRVFMLIKHTPRFWADAWLDIKTVRDGEPYTTRVPINVLRRPDTTIHKFAARALLGDLEMGRASIHQGPNAPQRGTHEEQTLARSEGEKLGCLWSLASRWTSFVAVEETPEGEQMQSPQSHEEPGFQVAEDTELNLLRRRPGARQPPVFPTLPEAPASDDGMSDATDESSDSSLSVISHRDGADTGSDDDDQSDDDPGMDNPGGGAVGGQSSTDDNYRNSGFQEGRGDSSSRNRTQQSLGSGSGGTHSQRSRPATHGTAANHSGQSINVSRQENINITRQTAPRRSGLDSTSKMDGSQQPSTSVFPRFEPPRKDHKGSKFGKDSKSKEYQSYRIDDLTSSFETFSPNEKVSLPSNNKPASTSLKIGSAFVPSSPEDMAKRRMVSQIIDLQAFDGSFSPSNAPKYKSGPNHLAETLGPGLQTLTEMMMDIMIACTQLRQVETIVWTVTVQHLLEIQFAAYSELWMLAHKKSSVFVSHETRVSDGSTAVQETLREASDFAESAIREARFCAFPSSLQLEAKPLDWSGILSRFDVTHMLIPLILPPTNSDPATIYEAMKMGRILPPDKLADIAVPEAPSADSIGSSSKGLPSSSLVGNIIRNYDKVLGDLAKVDKRRASRRGQHSVTFSPCDQFVTIT